MAFYFSHTAGHFLTLNTRKEYVGYWIAAFKDTPPLALKFVAPNSSFDIPLYQPKLLKVPSPTRTIAKPRALVNSPNGRKDGDAAYATLDLYDIDMEETNLKAKYRTLKHREKYQKQSGRKQKKKGAGEEVLKEREAKILNIKMEIAETRKRMEILAASKGALKRRALGDIADEGEGAETTEMGDIAAVSEGARDMEMMTAVDEDEIDEDCEKLYSNIKQL